jgi:hypothetical protein
MAYFNFNCLYCFFSSYFELRNAVDRYSDRGIPSLPVLPQLAGQTHALKLAIVNEILYPR